ncbi:hypothetical protein H920_01025 [Fukomys damarensis]|uniref:Uncharacterized protein n=1 Tax=Fukomys damarensis TaxID=885580 RepID=A0A091E4M8_FUKDA|nr:hypothetical protein H920_01025 [Fukomys damarensis]
MAPRAAVRSSLPGVVPPPASRARLLSSASSFALRLLLHPAPLSRGTACKQRLVITGFTETCSNVLQSKSFAKFAPLTDTK